MSLILWRCYIFFVMTIINQLVSAERRCPPQEAIIPCRCLLKGNDIQIWCSHSDLPNVLEGIRAVGEFMTEPIDELILENNYLPSLPGRTFLPLRAMRLMLRYNGLERVSSDWLAGLEDSLMELFVVEPELRSLPDDSLIRLNEIQAITIQTNLMKRFPIFSGLPKLRYLQLESLSLLELHPRNFKDLLALETIIIGNSPRLSRLEGGLLEDLPRLSMVNISYCGVSWMHPRAITRLPRLKELILIGNKIVDVGMVGRSTRDLPQLEILRLDHNYIDKVSEAAFVDLPSLRKLFLSNNHISELEYGAFHRVPKLRSLDLNKNNVRRVHPESFLQHSGSGLEELWLVDNDISHVAELRSLLDTLPRLTFLDMSYNNLEAIPFGALRGHPTLERLHLDYNKIHLIDPEAFMAMPALRELRLRNNSLSDILQGPFWNLPALKGLDLAGNFFRRLTPRLLSNLPSLRRLDLSENELTIIDPEAFIMTPALEHVNLSHNALSALHPATFRHLLNLYELDISHNHLMEFVPNLPRGVEYLYISDNRINIIPPAPNPDLDLPALKMIDLSGNEIMVIPDNSLTTLPQLRRLYIGKNALQHLEENSLNGLDRLEVLDLKNNQISRIHPKSLRKMEELRELNLKSNRMEILYPEIFKSTPKLKRLDVSNNKLAEILPGTLEKIRDIIAIDASHNFLVQLPPNLVALKNLKALDLTDNRLKFLNPETLNSLPSLIDLKLSKNFINELKSGAFDNMQHLRTLHLDNNELEAIESNAIRSLPLLKSLRLNNNKLREIPNLAFNNLPSLETAELQENQIKLISDNAFNQVPHLLMLNLSSNHLNNLEDAGLNTLKSLEMLDMSNNQITRITGKTLEKMEWLVELRLDDNSICAIHGSPFNGMPRLRVLTMRNNKMMSLPEQAFQQIRTNIAILDIDGNPLACSCNLLWMQAWLQESASLGPKCADGNLLRDMKILRQQCPPEERNVELVAPGCEAELLSAPGTFGTSQVFSPWMNLKANVSKGLNNKNHLAPSPEESEYFYDEYIDYPYNETNQIPNNTNKEMVQIATIEPQKSPHLTPGDTPTLYAASKNKTKPDVPKEIPNSPSSSGFTFFGVPLPSLNLNNLWGKNRMEDKKAIPVADRKTAIVNKPPRNGGRTGIFGQPPETFDLKPPMPLPTKSPKPPFEFSFSIQRPKPPEIPPQIPMMPQPGLPNSPEIQTGGFIPVLPGSGGFKPMTNINTEIPQQIQKPASSNIERINIPSTTDISMVSDKTELPHIYKEPSGHPIPTAVPVTSPISSQFAYTDSTPPISSPAVTEETAKIEELTQTPIEHFPELATITSEDKSDILEEETLLTTLPSYLSSSTIATTSTTTLKTSESEITTVRILPEPLREEGRKVIGTPLSALLIPGGQQPEFRPSGRPTITKVQSPHISGSAPLQANRDIGEISEPMAHNREGKTSRTHVTTTEVNMDPVSDTSWYFANYNKTNLEPFIGKGSTVPTTVGTGNGELNESSWFIFMMSYLILYIFN